MANWGSEMRESQRLDTDLNRIRIFAGKGSKISVRRSRLLAITSAASEISDELPPEITFFRLLDAFLVMVRTSDYRA